MSESLTVVIGGATGMGLAIAQELSKEGPVLIGGRRVDKVDAAVKSIRDAWRDAYGHQCDISDMASLNAFIEYAQSIGTIGNVINVAGVYVTQADIETIVRVNALGTVHVDNAFLPVMQPGSVMVNFASDTGHMYPMNDAVKKVWDDPDSPGFVERCLEICGTDPFGVYGFTKRFVIYHAAANASRYGKRGIRIFSISPGPFETVMMDGQDSDGISAICPMGRIGDPTEMARATSALLSDAFAYMSGCDVMIDGGIAAVSTIKQIAAS